MDANPGKTAVFKGGPMARTQLPDTPTTTAEQHNRLLRLDQDLDILDLHASELSAVEDQIQHDMKRNDREYKDSHFHSIPKPIKHTKP